MAVRAQRSVALPSHPRTQRWTLAELYRDHFDFVVRVAHRLGGGRLPAEDVAQEVFLVAARRLESFEPRADVTTWLYAIALNIVRSMRRRLRLEAAYRAEEFEGLKVPIIERDPIEVREACDLLSDIFESMSPRKRSVFFLSDIDELPCAQIARLVGIGEATVWSRLYYARRQFASKLHKRRLAEGWSD